MFFTVVVGIYLQDDHTSDAKRCECSMGNIPDHLHWETIRERIIRAGTLQKLVVNFDAVITCSREGTIFEINCLIGRNSIVFDSYLNYCVSDHQLVRSLPLNTFI